MSKFYLDSSSYVKGFRNEEHSEIISRLLQSCINGKADLVISPWTLSECISGLDKAWNVKKQISYDQMDIIIKDMFGFTYNRVRDGRMEIVNLGHELIERSWFFIRWYHLSADDALHAVCAAMGSVDYIIMADYYFSNRLKQQPDVAGMEDLVEKEEISYGVIDLLNDKDLEKLDSMDFLR